MIGKTEIIFSLFRYKFPPTFQNIIIQQKQNYDFIQMKILVFLFFISFLIISISAAGTTTVAGTTTTTGNTKVSVTTTINNNGKKVVLKDEVTGSGTSQSQSDSVKGIKAKQVVTVTKKSSKKR